MQKTSLIKKCGQFIRAIVNGLRSSAQLLVRLLLTRLIASRYKVLTTGASNLPKKGGALLLGNHISWIDWAVLQMASHRKLRFVMHKSIYQQWYLKGFLKLMGCIPIESGTSSKKTLTKVARLIDAGEVVVLFPEGAISHTGQLLDFKRGFERACEQIKSNAPIIPFFLDGLWGSQFSRAPKEARDTSTQGLRRKLCVAFGEGLCKKTRAEELRGQIEALGC